MISLTYIFHITCITRNCSMRSKGNWLSRRRWQQICMETQSSWRNRRVRYHLKMLMYRTATNSYALMETIHSWSGRQWKGEAGGLRYSLCTRCLTLGGSQCHVGYDLRDLVVFNPREEITLIHSIPLWEDATFQLKDKVDQTTNKIHQPYRP